jgi:large subunit ribosomal protein L29
MTAKELRQKNTQELYSLLEQQCAKLFKLRLQKGSDQLNTTHMLGDTKRLIARIRTLIAQSSRAAI